LKILPVKLADLCAVCHQKGGECWIPVPLAPPAPQETAFSAEFRSA
jgi:hypothetical protein